MCKRLINPSFFQGIKNLSQSYNKFHYSTSNNIFTSLSNDSKQFTNNIKCLDQIQFTIYGPSYIENYRILKPQLFEATIYMVKDNMRVSRSFKSNNYNDLIKEIQDYLNNQIKI
jgi:hypothetical protein